MRFIIDLLLALTMLVGVVFMITAMSTVDFELFLLGTVGLLIGILGVILAELRAFERDLYEGWDD